MTKTNAEKLRERRSKNLAYARKRDRERAKIWRKEHPEQARIRDLKNKLQATFGKSGWVVLQESQGLCKKCRIPCLDLLTLKSVPYLKRHANWNIHHIDFDRSNNVRVNLVFLCSSCHKIAFFFYSQRISKSFLREVYGTID